MDFYLRIIQDSEAKPDEIVVIACVHIVFGLNDIGKYFPCCSILGIGVAALVFEKVLATATQLLQLA